MSHDPVESERRWDVVATVADARQARELHILLEAAGIEVRVQVVDGAGRLPGVDGDFEPRSWTVLVPEDEVPVAVGVAERLLPWFATGDEGEVSEEECLAALDDPHEEDFAERLARERARRERVGRAAGGATLLLVIAAVAAFLTLLAQLLMG